MPSWNEKPHVVPTVNVNLKPCTTAHTCRSGHHTKCPGAPVLIPCPLPRSVTFTVRLGECGCPAKALPGSSVPHRDYCPAHPIRAACSISGKTWEESEVDEIGLVGRGPEDFTRSALAAGDVDFFSDSEREHALAACRERWALVKALVLGEQAEPAETEPVRSLIAQRDAVFFALCQLAQDEHNAWAQQRIIDSVFPVGQFATSESHSADLAKRPSAVRLAAYVEHLVEQVGVLQ